MPPWNRSLNNWIQEKLGNYVTFFSGLTYSPKDVVESDNGILVLRSSNIQDDRLDFSDNVYVNQEAVNSKYVEENDIVVVVRNGSRRLLGKHTIIKNELENAVIGAFMTGIQAKSPYFVNSLLSTTTFEKEMYKDLGATINQITNKNFKNMTFHVPQNEEANNIGDLFQKLDTIITLEHQRKDRVRTLKVALYKHIFGAIENKSGIYFDSPFATWKTYSIDKVIRKSFKGTMKVSDITPGDTEYLDANRLNGGSPIRCNTKSNVNINDILILWDGSNAGKVYKGFNGVLGSTLKSYKIKNEFDSSYIYHYLKWQENKILHSYTTPNIPHVVRDFEKIFEILIPEYKEQVKIGNILNSYDEMLDKYEENIEAYQKVKKILLSNIFV